MESPTPGIYWFNRPGWKVPCLVRVFDCDGKLAVSFQRGAKPTLWNHIALDATFTPSKVTETLLPFVQKFQSLYMEMAAFYGELDLTVEPCIQYLSRHNPDHEDVTEANAVLHRIKALVPRPNRAPGQVKP